MIEAVLDAGPLIHLTELNALDTLRSFGTLLVPDAVWLEVEHHQPSALRHSEIPTQRVSAPLPSQALLVVGRALALDRGEIEALSLMDLHPNAVLLTDDSAARLAAEHRAFRAHGTIGILIRSVREGIRSQRDVIDILRHMPERSTLYIRPSLLAEIIVGLDNEWNLASKK
ncbi:MAG: DNA-binding protein [Methanothrix sp.]